MAQKTVTVLAPGRARRSGDGQVVDLPRSAPPVEAPPDQGRDRFRPPRRRARVIQLTYTAVLLGLLWWAINPGDPGSWVIGVPAVAAATATAAAFPPRLLPALAPVEAIRFGVFFLRFSAAGAVDVALRAVGPRSRLEPGFLIYRTALPKGAPRHLFANTITLLPGTLTADLNGSVLTVHAIDVRDQVEAELAALERRVAALFGAALERPA